MAVCALFSAMSRFNAMLRVRVAAPVFVSWIAWFRGSEAAVRNPKETLAGDAARFDDTAAKALAFPAPTASTDAVAALSVTSCVAVFSSADFIWAAVSFGFYCLIRAAIPAICGVEKLVPCETR